jgi:Phosphotransferase enzyme family
VSLQSLGKPIAQGLTAEVYVWDETRILKLFRDERSPDQVAYEARIARAVHAAGLPVPAVGDIVEVNGRRGLLYERVDGLSMLDSMGQKCWTLSQSARLWAELHADLHARSPVPELPSQRAALCGIGLETVYLASLPIAHNFALASPGIQAVFQQGGKVVLTHSTEPADAFALIERERVTVTALVPALALRWIEARGGSLFPLNLNLTPMFPGNARAQPPFAAGNDKRHFTTRPPVDERYNLL